MLDKDVSQTAFALRMGMSKQSLSAFLARKDHRINADIIKYADALGYDVKLQFVDRQTGKVIDCD